VTEQPISPDVIAALAQRLRDPERPESAAAFPRDRAAAVQPGLYAWWADGHALSVLSAVLEASLPSLIYAGQAGATSWPSGRQGRATLRSRLASNHIGGNVRASTFRHTLAATAGPALGLEIIGPSRLTADSEQRLSAWICEHLRVAVEPFPDRDQLGAIEHAVLMILNPPLNLRGMPSSDARTRLRSLRRQLSAGT
jgi:hypothetical protein